MIQSRGLARIGVLVPFTNSNLEPDLSMICPPGISLHYARMGGYDADEVPDETQMQGLGASSLDEPLELLLGVRPDVIVYGCTSATLTHGPQFDRDLARRISAQSGAHTVTAAGSLIAALKALDVNRIGFASPYVPAINDLAIEFLAEQGVETVHRADVSGRLGNDEQGALTPQEVLTLGKKADHPAAEALVLSCTDMRSLEILSELEAIVGKPVICSNQAMMFSALRLLQHPVSLAGFGRLLNLEGKAL